MKILIKYNLEEFDEVERRFIPLSVAGKVYPVYYEDSKDYLVKTGKGRLYFVKKSLATIHHSRTRHGK